MNTEKIIVGSIIAVVVLFITLLIYDAVDTQLYKTVESKITVEQHYDGVENKRAAVDKCMQILETNGYTMCNASSKYHGNRTFIVVNGIKYSEKDSK